MPAAPSAPDAAPTPALSREQAAPDQYLDYVRSCLAEGLDYTDLIAGAFTFFAAETEPERAEIRAKLHAAIDTLHQQHERRKHHERRRALMSNPRIRTRARVRVALTRRFGARPSEQSTQPVGRAPSAEGDPGPDGSHRSGPTSSRSSSGDDDPGGEPGEIDVPPHEGPSPSGRICAGECGRDLDAIDPPLRKGARVCRDAKCRKAAQRGKPYPTACTDGCPVVGYCKRHKRHNLLSGYRGEDRLPGIARRPDESKRPRKLEDVGRTVTPYEGDGEYFPEPDFWPGMGVTSRRTPEVFFGKGVDPNAWKHRQVARKVEPLPELEPELEIVSTYGFAVEDTEVELEEAA